MGAIEAWRALDEPWRVCLQEAWESWCDGSAGVGAAVVDDRGTIIARGRNRRHDPRVSHAAFVGTPLAHAEMCALAALPPGSCERYTLYTSFEPCLMCAGAILISHIPRVHYAAADPLFDGMQEWLRALPYASARLPERECLGGPFGAFAHVLHLSWLAFWIGDGPVLAPHQTLAPFQHALAFDIVEACRLTPVAAARGTVTDALDVLWPDLVSLG